MTYYNVPKNELWQIILINPVGGVIALVGPGNATLTLLSCENHERCSLRRFPILGLFSVAYVCSFSCPFF